MSFQALTRNFSLPLVDEFTIYPNYALAGTKAADLYTQPNADRLEAIRKKTDPNDVMKLTTFFDFTS